MVDCSLVAGTPVRDLLLCAKHLFVAAMLAGCGTTTHPSEPSRALGGTLVRFAVGGMSNDTTPAFITRYREPHHRPHGSGWR